MTTMKHSTKLPAMPVPGSFEPRATSNAAGEADMQGALLTSILVMYPAVASIGVILAGMVYFGAGFTA